MNMTGSEEDTGICDDRKRVGDGAVITTLRYANKTTVLVAWHAQGGGVGWHPVGRRHAVGALVHSAPRLGPWCALGAYPMTIILSFHDMRKNNYHQYNTY